MKYTKYLICILLLFFSVQTFAQFQYSIDDNRGKKKNRASIGLKIKLKLRSWFREDKQKKADKKKLGQLERAEENQKKGVYAYQKRQGSDKEITSREKVSTRMKKMKKQSSRINKDKSRETFFRRLFIKHKQKPTKFKK